MPDLEEFFMEVNAALADDAPEWVIEACRKKLKKYPDEPALTLHLCLAGLYSERLGMTLNKLLPQLQSTTGPWRLAFLGLLGHCLNRIKDKPEQWPNIQTEPLEKLLKETPSLFRDYRTELLKILPPKTALFLLLVLGTPKKDLKKAESGTYLEEEFLLSFLEHRPFNLPPNIKSKAPRLLDVPSKLPSGLHEEASCIVSEMNIPDYLKIGFQAEAEASKGCLLQAYTLTQRAIQEGWKGPVPKARLTLYLLGRGKYKEAQRALQNIPKNTSSALYAEGNLLVYKKKYTRALKLFQRIPSQAPFSERLSLSLMECYMCLGQHEKAKPHLQDLVQNGNDKILVRFAHHLCAEEKYESCLFACEQLPYPDEEVVFFKAISLHALKRYEEAVSCCQRLLNTTDPGKLAWILDAFSKKTEILLPYANRLLELEPNNIRAQEIKARALFRKGRYTEAEHCLSLLKNKTAHYLRAQCLEKVGRHEDAIPLYEKAVSLKSRQIQVQKAIRQCTKVIKEKKTMEELRRKAETYLQSKEWGKLFETARTLLHHIPKDIKAQWWLARACNEQGDEKRARKHYQTLSWAAIKDEEILNDLAAKAAWLGLPKESILKKLEEISPINPHVCWHKALQLHQEGKTKDALFYLDKASQDPEIAAQTDFVQLYGDALLNGQKYEEAIQWYQKIPEKKSAFQIAYCLWKTAGNYEIYIEPFFHSDFQELQKEWQPLKKTSIDEEEQSRFLAHCQHSYACYLLRKGLVLEAAKTYAQLSSEDDADIKKAVAAFTQQHETSLPVYLKTQLGAEGKRLTLCDTNVLVFKILGELSEAELFQAPQCRVAIQQFERLLRKDILLYLPPHIVRETTHVLSKILTEISTDPENKKRLHQAVLLKIRELEKNHPLSLPEALTADETLLSRIKEFYQKHEKTLRELTEKKCQGLTEHESQRKRAEREYGYLPESGDRLLLAQAASLAQKPLRGVRCVSLLSDDSDFHTFQREIEETFGVQVKPLIGAEGDAWWELLNQKRIQREVARDTNILT